MKVSIITIHDPDVNYGSTLQSCGTYNFVRNLGYEAQIINYKPNYYKLKKRIKKKLPKILFAKNAIQRRKKIDNYFAEHAKLTRRYKNHEDLFRDPPISDVFITGSDVIWNKDINPEGADSAFYLDFVNSGIKMSFSPSMGELQRTENINEIIGKISDYKFISVREELSKKQLNELGLHNVVCTMDPVFLLNKEYYDKQTYSNKYGDYTLIYLMSNTDEKRKIVHLVSTLYQNRTIGVGGFKRKADCDYYIRNAGVEDFLTLIKHARHIITDSFHCVAFSLIFNKQFLYLPSIDSSMRIENLLSYANLDRRIIKKYDLDNIQKEINNPINYYEVNKLLEQHIINTRHYLEDCLLQCQSIIAEGANE